MMLNGIERSMVFFLSISFLPSFSSIFFFIFFPLPSHGLGFEHHASVPNFPNSSLSGVHPFPSSKHFPSYISISNISFCPHIFFYFLLCFRFCFRLLCVCQRKKERTRWQVNFRGKSGPFPRQRPAPLLRDPWTQFCMGGKKIEKGQFLFLFGDARMRIRENVQTMPGLEGRGGAAAAGGGGREMGDGERISLLVIFFFFGLVEDWWFWYISAYDNDDDDQLGGKRYTKRKKVFW